MMTSAYPIGAPIAMTRPLRVTGSCATAQFGVAAHTPAADRRKGKTEKRISPPRWTVHLRTTQRFFPYSTGKEGPLDQPSQPALDYFGTMTPSKVTERGEMTPAVSTVTSRSGHRLRTLMRRFVIREPVPT